MSQAPTIHERKKNLRAEMRFKLQNLSKAERRHSSHLLTRALFTSPLWEDSRNVALFASRNDEPDILNVIESAWQLNRQVFLPKVIGNDLEFYAVKDKHELQPGTFGILEPDLSHCHHVEPSEIDLILVPGLAFDREGLRLGRGKGFYDRFLARPGVQARSIGLFFSLQEVEKIPSEGHDRKLDGIITEAGLKIVRSAP